LKVLLTGASGLLGAHLLQELLQNGYQVKCIARQVPVRSYLHEVQNRVQTVSCDLTRKQTWPSDLMHDVSTVIHAAALVSPDPLLQQEMQKTNLLATQTLFEQAQNKTQWIQISSVSTYSDGHATKPVDETYQGGGRPTAYAQSKRACDQWLAEQDSSILFIHPCFLLGDWDAKPSSGAVLLGLRLAEKIRYLNKVKNFVAASDVAHGIILAMQKKATGHYILGNENISVQDFLSLLKTEMKLNSILEEIQESEITALNFSAHEKYFISEFCQADAVSWQKAQRDFNYQPQKSAHESLKEALSYFVKYRLMRA
jgi:nucleoside-diphosphate-sugar epimerase